MDNTINFLKLISDKNRLMILYLLTQHTLCVCDIQKVIPLTQGALSIQLKNLTVSGILKSSKQGKWVFYKISDKLSPSKMKIISEIFAQIKNDPDVLNMINKLTISETCTQ